VRTTKNCAPTDRAGIAASTLKHLSVQAAIFWQSEGMSLLQCLPGGQQSGCAPAMDSCAAIACAVPATTGIDTME
jgi:hypothetical protein